MNVENLIPLNKRSKEERRIIQEKGRQANIEKWKKRKTFKEELLLLLSQSNNQEKISIAVIQEALKGNTKAFEVIRDTVGEKPKDEIDLNGKMSYEKAIKEVSSENEY